MGGGRASHAKLGPGRSADRLPERSSVEGAQPAATDSAGAATSRGGGAPGCAISWTRGPEQQGHSWAWAGLCPVTGSPRIGRLREMVPPSHTNPSEKLSLTCWVPPLAWPSLPADPWGGGSVSSQCAGRGPAGALIGSDLGLTRQPGKVILDRSIPLCKMGRLALKVLSSLDGARGMYR